MFLDGRLISRTGAYPELSDPVRREEYRDLVDMVSDHLYPLSVDKLRETASTSDAKRNAYGENSHEGDEHRRQ